MGKNPLALPEGQALRRGSMSSPCESPRIELPSPGGQGPRGSMSHCASHRTQSSPWRPGPGRPRAAPVTQGEGEAAEAQVSSPVSGSEVSTAADGEELSREPVCPVGLREAQRWAAFGGKQ